MPRDGMGRALECVQRLARRARALTRARTLDAELDAEVRLHIDLETDDLVRTRGLSPEEARRRALVAFGGVERYKEAQRDARGVRWIEELAQDLRYAVRGLLRSPAFSLSAVLVLGLGIGATTAVFSAVHAVLLAPFPYPRADRIVRIYQQDGPTNRWGLSVVDFRAIEAQQRSFSAVGVLKWSDVPASVGGRTEQRRVVWATSGIFRALAVHPAYGRAPTPDDDRPGAPRVVVASDAFAVRAFGSAASAVGKTVAIDGLSHTIVGVLAPEVRRLAGVRGDLWPAFQLPTPTRRGPFGHVVIARLADGVTLDAAAADLAGISERLFPEWASSYQNARARFTPVPLRETIVVNARKALGLFGVAVSLVLLVAVANVSHLVLVRVMGRSREVALRTVLGATRARLARMWITESVVLAAAGGAAGLLVGALGLRVLVAVNANLARIDEARLDTTAVLFAAGVSLVVAVIMGAYPAALLLRRDLGTALRSGDRSVAGARRVQSLRGVLLVAELALTVPLLAATGLLLNSIVRLERVDPGFPPEHLLALHVALPAAQYADDSSIATLWTRALPRIREVHGIVHAGLGTAMPPDDPWDENNFDLIDYPVPSGGTQPVSPWPLVTSEYFAALGVPLLAGRLFGPADTVGAPPEVVVSRSWVRHYLPDGRAVGRQLIAGGCTSCPPTTIVGVVGDVKYRGLAESGDAVYEPLSQGWSRDVNLFLRTTGSSAEVGARVRAVLQSLEPGASLDGPVLVSDRLAESVARPRAWTALLASFAGAALVLAAIGIFGTLSDVVSARRREIGVRMALGATPRAIVSAVVGQGMRYALAGAVLGLAAAAAGARWMGSVLFEVSPGDPLTLAAVTVLLLAVAGIACWLPARRAATVDPADAIRVE
ncbi:MAG: ABC transporter permease [Gemmatimonadaceae bacterium]|nr:ABC transporter permease [Gemmatimonadaceae bacterium]